MSNIAQALRDAYVDGFNAKLSGTSILKQRVEDWKMKAKKLQENSFELDLFCKADIKIEVEQIGTNGIKIRGRYTNEK